MSNKGGPQLSIERYILKKFSAVLFFYMPGGPPRVVGPRALPYCPYGQSAPVPGNRGDFCITVQCE